MFYSNGYGLIFQSFLRTTPCVTGSHNLQNEATQLLAVRVAAVAIPIFVSCPIFYTAQQGFLARNELLRRLQVKVITNYFFSESRKV